MINMIIDNWYMLFTALAVGFVGGYLLKKFFQQPTASQVKCVKEWLVWACVEAERLWGSKTGTMKLREVYDWFVSKFPAIAAIVSFDTFSEWVSESLEIAKHIMETNETVKNYVG